jgi:hypothetical protein
MGYLQRKSLEAAKGVVGRIRRIGFGNFHGLEAVKKSTEEHVELSPGEYMADAEMESGP